MFQAEIIAENAAYLVEGGMILPGSSDNRDQRLAVPPCATTVTCPSDRERFHWNNMIATDPGGKRTEINTFVHPRNPGDEGLKEVHSRNPGQSSEKMCVHFFQIWFVQFSCRCELSEKKSCDKLEQRCLIVLSRLCTWQE